MANLFAKIGRRLLAAVPTHHPRFASHSSGPPRNRPPRQGLENIAQRSPRAGMVDEGGLGEDLGDIGKLEVLNKAIAASGFASRRQAALLVTEGRVAVALLPSSSSSFTPHLRLSSLCAQVCS